MSRKLQDITPQLILTFENEKNRESAIKALARLEQNQNMGAFSVQKVDFPMVAQMALWDGGKS